MQKIKFYLHYLFFFIKYILIDKELSKVTIKNKECIVLGNGPSLKGSLLNQLFFKNKSIIAVNNFVTSDIFTEIQPNYYVIADSSFWDNTYYNNENNENVKNNSNRLINIRKSFSENIIKKVKWEMVLFIPLQAKGKKIFNLIKAENQFIKIIYYNMTPINIGNINLRNCLYKYNFGMPTSQTVLISSIFIALNIGFKKIFVLGGDHSWHEDFYIDNDNVLYTKDKHFYNNGFNLIPVMSDGKNHSRFHDELLSLYKAFKGHILLEEYSRYLGAKIYNASKKSYIDAYERFNIDKKD